MLTRTSFLGLGLFLAAPGLGWAQEPPLLIGGGAHAHATLHSRIAGDRVRVAIELKIDRGWHLYHHELGHPRAIGIPMRVELTGEGIGWTDVRFPEAHPLEQPESDAFILAHEGTIALYAGGLVAEGVTPGPIGAHLVGQTCDDKSCVNYEQTIESQGAGPDALFAAFPEELFAPRPKDQHGGGEADAALFTRRDGRTIRAAIEVAITPGWHLYHSELGNDEAVGKPTTVTLSGEGVAWGSVVFPEPEKVEQPAVDAWILAHEGTIVLHAQGEIAAAVDAPGPITAVIEGLTCQDGEGGVCVLYRESLVDRGAGAEALFSRWEEERDSSTSVEVLGEKGDLAAFLGLAVFWGLFTLLMPCTYPMIPITVSFFTKQAAERKSGALSLSIAYGLGIVLIFIFIGVVFGRVIIPFATHPITNLVIGVLFFYFALVLFGIVNLQPPRFLLEAAGKASATGGWLGVFLMGVTLVVSSFTCTAPFVASLLLVGAQDGGLGRTALGMGVFGLTMAVPFVLLSLVPGFLRQVPRSGEWMNTLKVFLGFVELAAAFKFLSNSDLVWEWEILSREVFLLLWVAIFVASAIYLLGLWPGKRARPGPTRVVTAFLVLGFTGYCAWGMTGKEMDSVMTAIIPNYSGGRLMPKWRDFGVQHQIAIDDYDGAVERARTEGKIVLVNFTGHT